MCSVLLFRGENRHSVLCVVFFCLEVRINTLYCVYSSFCLAASDTVWESVLPVLLLLLLFICWRY